MAKTYTAFTGINIHTKDIEEVKDISEVWKEINEFITSKYGEFYVSYDGSIKSRVSINSEQLVVPGSI